MVNKSQKRSFFGVIFFTLLDKVISKTTNKFALESIFFRSLKANTQERQTCLNNKQGFGRHRTFAIVFR